MKALEAQLVALHQEIEQAGLMLDHFILVRDIIKSLSNTGLADLRQYLITLTEGSWDDWGHPERCYAVQESWVVHAILVARDTAASKAAGIDPYSTPSLSLPSPKTRIGLALLNEREYRLPNPLSLSMQVSELEKKLQDMSGGT